VPDLEIVRKALATPEGLEAMAHDGVLPESVVLPVESGSD
jgi:hypothetical protein